jgi:CBS domain-containing protein
MTRSTLSAAERIMREAQIRRLPAVDEHGELMGIISLSDIALAATSSADEVAQTIVAISKQHPSSAESANA